MSVNIVIRKALSTDIDELIALLQLLFVIETDFAIDKDKQRRGLEMIIAEQQRCCLLVAEQEQKIVGMCSAQLLISTAEGGVKAIIEDLVINEAYRQQGVGQQILGELEKWAMDNGAKRLDLLADRGNDGALEFYKKNKWKSTALICLQKKP